MSYGDERRYGNQQSFGNRNGSGGGFQKKADKPDLTFAPQSLEFKFYVVLNYIILLLPIILQKLLLEETPMENQTTFLQRS